ncbi:MAG: Hsp20/alpha crystallin family protein [Phycisphaerae bacterium]
MPSSNGKNETGSSGFEAAGGFLGGLADLVQKLGRLAETGRELRKEGEIRDPEGNVRGIFGYNVRVGIGGEDVHVEPFGNVGKDQETGEAVVHEVREPMVDVFEEEDHVLVVAEVPGVSEGDLHVDLADDILILTAEAGETKYRKEVLLPQAFEPHNLSYTCRNGVLKIKLLK